MSDKESANCRSLLLMLLNMVFRFKLWMEKFRWNDLEHCISWENGCRNFEPLTESDGRFSWTGHATGRVWKKEKAKTNPVRSERHVVHACPRLTKTCSLSPETLQTNPHSQRRKSRDKKLWCHSSAILRPWRVSLSINWIGFIFVWPSSSWRFQFSFVVWFFVQIRGVQPATHGREFFCVTQTGSKIFPSFFFRRFDHFSYQFFDRFPKLWKKLNCGPETNFGIRRPWFGLRALKSSILRRALSAGSWDWCENHYELGDGVSSGSGLIQLISKTSAGKSMICCLRNSP